MLVHDYLLRSERLGFRRWTPDDLPSAQLLWGDLAVTKFFGGPFPPVEIERRLRIELERNERYGFQYWPIHRLTDGQFAGCCGLRPYLPEEKIPELGFHLRPAFWGQGLAGEAARRVIEYAFTSLNVAALSAGHHPDNVNSKKVLERIGFRYTRDEHFAALGIEIPYYLLERRAYESGKVKSGK